MPHSAAAKVSGSVLDVLVISGDESLCVRLEALLESMGKGALSVGSVQQAREAMKAVFFPLLIVERTLADGDGLNLSREYRLHNAERAVSVVLLSDVTNPGSRIPSGIEIELNRHATDEEFRRGLSLRQDRESTRRTHTDEAARLASLKSYDILDTQGEREYDDITQLAAHIARAPIALLSLVDDYRQWFKSRLGLALEQTPREYAFCAHAIEHPEGVFVVPDATEDLRFAENPLVVGEPHIRFYAGAPLVTADGFALGTVCVMDNKPRTLDAEGQAALAALARQAGALLEHRRRGVDLEKALIARRQMESELRRSEALFREAYENAPIGIALVSPDGAWLRVNQSLCDLVGYSEEELLRTNFQAITHPDDLAADLGLVKNVLAGSLRRYELEKRYLHRRGHVIWVTLSVSLVRDEDDKPLFFVSQIQDISARKQESSSPRVSIVFGAPGSKAS
ncbi:MAG: PAS domain S-box protein [Povalibacter sp.]